MKGIKVPYIDLGLQHKLIIDPLMKRMQKVMLSGSFILGDEVREFERRFAEIHQTRYAVGLANGTDALILSLRAIGIKSEDEVITCPNSFLASASSIYLSGARPVFCDVGPDMNMSIESLERAITPKTRAIIPIHLTGKPAMMEEIMQIADKHGLFVIEDSAQAVGARLGKKPIGSYGITGCFSMHPLKNLAACGDAGIVTTNNDEVYSFLVKARNHGLRDRDHCDFFSMNSRLDNLQASILNVKLDYLPAWNERRREIAGMYNTALREYVVVPELDNNEYAVFHTYIIQSGRRDELMTYLDKSGIETKIHYPVSIHEQEAWKSISSAQASFPETERLSGVILSLPVFPELTNEQVDYVIDRVRNFFRE